MIYVTLNTLRRHRACKDSMNALKTFLGPDWDKAAPIYPSTELLEAVGLDAMIWALRATPKAQDEERDRVSRLFGAWCARQCLPNYESAYPNDSRIRDCIDTAERYANGNAADEELSAAKSAAESAARSAAWSARSAAKSATEFAAWYARFAAKSATEFAAKSATESAAWSARSAAAWSARSAAESAAWPARFAAESAAESAAWSADRSAQAAALMHILTTGSLPTVPND
jgi:hypothetical protein